MTGLILAVRARRHFPAAGPAARDLPGEAESRVSSAGPADAVDMRGGT